MDMALPRAGSCYNAGDVNSISVGDATSLHDRVLVHVGATGPASKKRPAVIGSRVNVGQGSILHACTIHDEANVGAGAHVLDGATIERHGMLDAGAVLAPGATIKAGEVRSRSPHMPGEC
jgi:carbonic anhydrase/acetyltransferase-like protein (isoleucine patch superfamily)